jgi:hypothetical protein
MITRRILLIAFVIIFVAMGASTQAMVVKLGSYPECIKHLHVWQTDQNGDPNEQLSGYPAYIYGEQGGALHFKWELVAYHGNSQYDYDIKYVSSSGSLTNISSGSTYTSANPVNHDTPAYFSTGPSANLSATCQLVNNNNDGNVWLEENCGGLRFVFTCKNSNCQRCNQTETFNVPIVFEPSGARTIEVEALRMQGGNWVSIGTSDLPSNEEFRIRITYDNDLWLSDVQKYCLMDISLEEYDLDELEFTQDTPGCKIESYECTFTGSGTCDVDAFVIDSLGQSTDYVIFTFDNF